MIYIYYDVNNKRKNYAVTKVKVDSWFHVTSKSSRHFEILFHLRSLDLIHSFSKGTALLREAPTLANSCDFVHD